jgi:hypothetical protein
VYYPDDNTGRYKSLAHHGKIDKKTNLKIKFKIKYQFGKNGICDLWTRPWGERYHGFTTNYESNYPKVARWIRETEKAIEKLGVQDIRVVIDIKVPEVVVEFAGTHK